MKRALRLKREDGVAMTEFALVIPVFVLVIAGLLAFGRVFFYWIEANHIANETARWAAVDRMPPGTTATTLQEYARNSGGTVEFGDARVCINVPGGGTPALGGPIEVRVAKSFSFVPILGIGDITIRGSSTMRIERFANGTTPSYTYNADGSPYGACT